MPSPFTPSDTIRRGIRVRRRRRIAGVAAAVAAVVGLSGVAYSVADPTGDVPSPAGKLTVVPSASAPSPADVNTPSVRPAPAKPPTASVRLQDLRRDGDPTVDTVQRGRWQHAGGGRTDLKPPDPPANSKSAGESARQSYNGTFIPFDGGLLSVMTVIGHEPVVQHFPDGRRLDIDFGEMEARVVPGPDGSVLWADADSTDDTLVIGRLDPDGTRSAYEVEVRNFGGRFAAGADSLFVETGEDEVTRYDLTGGQPTNPERLPGFTGVISADPGTDQALLEITGDDPDTICSTVVDAADPVDEWSRCGYRLTAQSPDGQYVYGYDNIKERGAVFDREGTMILKLKGGSEDARFDEQNRLNVLTHGPFDQEQMASETALATCDLDGDCRRTSGVETVPANSGYEPLTFVGTTE